MGTQWIVAAAVAIATVAGSAPRVAHADLPPPPGTTRVSYSFRLTGSANGAVLIAFPMHNHAGGSVLPLELDREWVPIQGFVPGIYAVPPDVLPSILGKQHHQEQERRAVEALLAERGHVCVKSVPRVFTLPSSTGITSMVDVFRVDASPAGCRAAFLTTVYGGARGESGQGWVDPSGVRVPPAPFGGDLPPVGDIGVAFGPAAPAASRGSRGCGSCAASSADAASVAISAVLLGVAVVALRRGRRGRRGEAPRD